MKTVIYKGATAAVGRFGTIEEGAHLQLTEAEFAGVKDDPDFELISRRKPARDILPLGTPFYDLRVIEWDSARLTLILENEGKSTLKNIVLAMNALGCDLVVTEHDNTPIIVDAIVAEAAALNWSKIDLSKRRELGFMGEVETEDAVQENDSQDADEEEDGEGEQDGETESRYATLTVKKLRTLCKELEIESDGDKAELIARLEAFDAAQAE